MIKHYYFIFLKLVLIGLIFISPQILLAQTEVIKEPVLYSSTKFHIAINGGLGYLVGDMKTSKSQMKEMGVSNEEANRYYDDFKGGRQAGIAMHYMLFPYTGIGLDYNIFTTNSQMMLLLLSNDNRNYLYGKFSEKIYTNYLGLSLQPNQVLSDKLNLYEILSMGMAFYRNESQVIFAPALITGNAMAVKGESGISYQLQKHLSLNLGVSYFISTLKKIKLKNGTETVEMELPEDSKENLSRLNLSAGIQFNF